jgi:CheY-like chemotaxis protein
MIRALVCDDYEPIANLITAFLDGMGITVTIAGDGNQALDLIHNLRPDLIISDIDMPGLNGVELFTALRSDTTGLADIPFILMSSVDRQRDALEAGCSHFLTKPFTADEVRQMVRRALSGIEGPLD